MHSIEMHFVACICLTKVAVWYVEHAKAPILYTKDTQQ